MGKDLGKSAAPKPASLAESPREDVSLEEEAEREGGAQRLQVLLATVKSLDLISEQREVIEGCSASERNGPRLLLNTSSSRPAAQGMKERNARMFTGEKRRSSGDREIVRLKTSPKNMVFNLSNKHTHTRHTHAQTRVRTRVCAHIHVLTYMHVHAHTHIHPYTDAHTLNESGYLENVVKSDVWTQIFGEKN